MNPQFIKATTRKEAILKCLSTEAQATAVLKGLSAVNTKAFEVSYTDSTLVQLAYVTDVVVGQYANNIFKVEIVVMPK